MQNEKQIKVFKVHEKIKIFRKKVWWTDKRHTHPGKCLLKHESIQWRWIIWKEKEVRNRKRKVQQKGFHMVLGAQNPRIKRYRNFFPALFLGEFGKRAEKKKVAEKNSKSDEVWTKS